MAVLEGESLVNDASALVVLRTASAVIAATSQFSLGRAGLDFLWAVVGAVLVGLLVGQLTVLLRQRLDDPVLNTTLSFAVPFLAYFPAEEVGASGVLAVVVAGLVTGAQGSRRFSARDRQTQATTWTTVSFVLESTVFLAMGYQLPELVDAARGETSYAELAGLVGVVLALLVGLRFLGLVWPALDDRDGRDAQGVQQRSRLDQFEERSSTRCPLRTGGRRPGSGGPDGAWPAGGPTSTSRSASRSPGAVSWSSGGRACAASSRSPPPRPSPRTRPTARPWSSSRSSSPSSRWCSSG